MSTQADLFGTAYDPFNATKGKIWDGNWNLNVGPLAWREEPFRPLKYELSPFDPDAEFQLTDKQFD